MIYSDSFAIVIVMYIYSQYIYIMVLFLYKHAVKNFSVCFLLNLYIKKKNIYLRFDTQIGDLKF